MGLSVIGEQGERGVTDGRAAALLRGFDVPGVGRFVVGGEDLVVDVGVDVFGVDEARVGVKSVKCLRIGYWGRKGCFQCSSYCCLTVIDNGSSGK